MSKSTRPTLDLRSPSAGRLKPNLGTSEDNDDGLAPPSWSDIIKFYRGSELQLYFVGLICSLTLTQLLLNTY